MMQRMRNFTTSPWHILLWIVSGIVYAGNANAQAISRKDADEIRVLAREKIKGLGDLLNAISNEDLSNYERRYLMMNSYMPGNDQIFFNDGVIVEDDIDAKHTTSAPGLDTPIEKYLSNFDLFYTKSERNSVEFSGIVVSDVKVESYPFVKVFYTEQFKGKNNRNNMAYQPAPRVAELRANRVGNDWVVYITRIAFNSLDNAKNIPVSPTASAKYDSLQRQKEPVVSQVTDKKPVVTPENEKIGQRLSQELNKATSAQVHKSRNRGIVKLGAGVAALAFGAITYGMLNKDYKDYKNKISNAEGLTSYAKPGIYISAGSVAVGLGLSISSIFDFKK